MLSKYKVYSETKLQTLAKNLSWINPNFLTVLGIVPAVLFFVFMQDGNYPLAAIMLALTSIDMLDGIIARANNRETAFGGFLDSTLDRVSDFLIIAGLYAGKLVGLEIAAVLLLTTFLISYVRSRGELASNSAIKFDVGLIERPERIIFIFIVLVLQIFLPNALVSGMSLTNALLYLLTLLSIYTLTQRISYAYETLTNKGK